MNTTGTLEHVAPSALIVETNVRTVTALPAEFVDSIRQNGVLTPILAWRDQAGGLNVRAGQRRTLAARDAGIDTVPVYVVDAVDDDTAKRIVEQLIENEHRDDLTDTDRIAAWRALELEGLSVTAIAKRTGTKRDRIKTGLAVATSDTGKNLVASFGMTLDQAAALLEFEDDPETVADLTRTATDEPDYFPVAVQRARNERTATARRETIEQEHAAKGHRILTESPSHGEAPFPRWSLATPDGERVTTDMLDGKEGVAVHVRTWAGHETAHVDYYVDDPAALGLIAPEPSNTPAGPMTDEQKAERKTLIANNKEWDAAETVRREWVTQFLARKTLPKDAVAVTAQCFVHARHLISDSLSQGNGVAKAFLGIEDGHGNHLEDYLTAHPARAGHITLAIALGGIEQRTDRNTWRTPREETAQYLRALAAWGYPLCPVEKIAAQIND